MAKFLLSYKGTLTELTPGGAGHRSYFRTLPTQSSNTPGTVWDIMDHESWPCISCMRKLIDTFNKISRIRCYQILRLRQGFMTPGYMFSWLHHGAFLIKVVEYEISLFFFLISNANLCLRQIIIKGWKLKESLRRAVCLFLYWELLWIELSPLNLCWNLILHQNLRLRSYWK